LRTIRAIVAGLFIGGTAGRPPRRVGSLVHRAGLAAGLSAHGRAGAAAGQAHL